MFEPRTSVSYGKLIIIVAFLMGLLIAWSVFTGDQLGRVNLIHLIFLYVFFPIISLVFSLLSLLFGNGLNFAKLVRHLPLLPDDLKRKIRLQSQSVTAKTYFFYQSQIAALSFSFASLLVFVLLLISSDINFVWRSTLMDAHFIYPLLKWIAVPWHFWVEAQPDFSLLLATQESRITAPQKLGINFGDWWRFIFAGQLFYAIFLRSFMALASRLLLNYQNRHRRQNKRKKHREEKNYAAKPQGLVKIVNHIDRGYSLTNWGGLDAALTHKVTDLLSQPKLTELRAGPFVKASEQLLAERWQGPQVVIVKGWEPPLGELADYLECGNGYLLPLDWDNSHLQRLKASHLDEWRRFIHPHTSWKLLQLDALKGPTENA